MLAHLLGFWQVQIARCDSHAFEIEGSGANRSRCLSRGQTVRLGSSMHRMHRAMDSFRSDGALSEWGNEAWTVVLNAFKLLRLRAQFRHDPKWAFKPARRGPATRPAR